jgi:hypothetical protein
MNEFKNAFVSYDSIIRKNSSDLGLKSLSEIKIDGENSITLFTNLLQKKKCIRDFHFYKFFSEISFISEDIKYFTSLLYLLKPYINNPLKENLVYYQTIEDDRYLSYASILVQAFYNYWDRIGDLIYSFLNVPLKERNVYFITVLENLDETSKKSEYYISLYELYNSKLTELFSKRKQIVHYFQISSETFVNTVINHNNPEMLAEGQKIKEGLPDLFKENIEYTFQGIELALKLIDKQGTPK